jgi:hypothetical protein
MNSTVIIIVEGQAFRFQCHMTLEDEDELKRALASQVPQNLEIEVKEMWCLFNTKAGGTIFIKGGQP